ncbi:MAG: ribonuclease HII [Candidatus Omnitrophica bacterium]|nr:ribonuclease HII [Candidatus Omnitrophota bacterium]
MAQQKRRKNLKKVRRPSKAINHKRLLRYENAAAKRGLKLIAGVDEAGRGPLAGPVVAGAVILKTFDFKNRIDDSKKLSAGARERAFGEIIRNAHIGVGVVSEGVIDEVNIRKATIHAMELALEDLGQKPDYVLIDGRVKLTTPAKRRNIIRGDSASLSIAAASIVAKVVRDRIMLVYDKVFPQYRFKRHKGYGTKAHVRAIRKHGPSMIHRKSFRVKELEGGSG